MEIKDGQMTLLMKCDAPHCKTEQTLYIPTTEEEAAQYSLRAEAADPTIFADLYKHFHEYGWTTDVGPDQTPDARCPECAARAASNAKL